MANSLFQSKAIVNNDPAITASGGNAEIVAHADYTFSVAPAAGDIVEMLVLPANHVLTDAIWDTDDLDTGTTLTAAIGTMAGTPGDTTFANRTVTANILSTGDTSARAAAVVRANAPGFTRIAPSDSDQSIGVNFIAASSGISGTPTMRLTIKYRPKRKGV